MQVERRGVADVGNFRKIGVGRHDPEIFFQGQINEHRIDRGPRRCVHLFDVDIDVRVVLHEPQVVQPAAAAISLGSICRVGQRVQLSHHELRDDQGRVHEAGLSKGVHASIDEGRGVQQHRAKAANLLGKLDVGDDQPNTVSSREHDGYSDVGEGQSHREFEQREVLERFFIAGHIPCLGDEIDEDADRQ